MSADHKELPRIPVAMPTLLGGIPDSFLGDHCLPRQLKGAFFGCYLDNNISLLSRGETNTPSHGYYFNRRL